MEKLQVRIKGWLDGYFASDALSLPQLTRIFLPIVWEQVFLAGMSLLSIWMLSFDSLEAMSVVNMMTVINQVFISICLGLVTGGTVLVAQNMGAGRRETAGRTVVQSMGFAFLFTTVLGAVLFLTRQPMVAYLLEGAGEEIISQAVVYFAGFCLSFPFYALYQSFAGSMRGWGNTKTALRLTILVNCLELGLTAVLVLGFHMGVLGITLAMVLSRMGGAAVAAVLLAKQRHSMGIGAAYLRPDWAIIRGILLIAVPLALEQFFFNSGKAVAQRFIAGYGTDHMAANGVVNAVFNLINIPQASFQAAAVTVVGMCVGRGSPGLAKEYIDKFLRSVRVLLLALMPLTIPLSILLTSRYHLSSQATSLTYWCLAIVFVFGPLFLGGAFTAPAGLRAGGDAAYVSLIALSCVWLVRVVFSYVFTRVIPLGVVGINIAMALEWSVRTLLYRVRLRTPLWYQHRLLVNS